MDTSEFLARHHRRVVDESIESVLCELDLGNLERNVVGVAIRWEVETELVPGIVVIQAVFHAADAAALEKTLPEWLDLVSSVLPTESEFLAGMGQSLDPDGYGLLADNLRIRPGESEIRRIFDAHLWEMAPCISRAAN